LLLQRSAQADPGEDSHDDDNEAYDVDDGVHLGDPCDALMVLDNCEQGTLVAAAAQKSCSADESFLGGTARGRATYMPLHIAGSDRPRQRMISPFG
jgi:hypothetical protein